MAAGGRRKVGKHSQVVVVRRERLQEAVWGLVGRGEGVGGGEELTRSKQMLKTSKRHQQRLYKTGNRVGNG